MSICVMNTTALTKSSILTQNSTRHKLISLMFSPRRPVISRSMFYPPHTLSFLFLWSKDLLVSGSPKRMVQPHAVIGDATEIPSNVLKKPSEFVEGLGVVYANDKDVKMEESGSKSYRGLKGQNMIRVCDKLIEVFMVDKPRTTDWRRLLAFSKEWCNIRLHFFKRCEERAAREDDPDMKHKLLRLGRKLKEIDEDVQRHDELLKVVRSAPSEINDIISKRRKDFTSEFFEHLHTVAESYYENPIEQNDLAKLGNTCLTAVQAYDNASESIESVRAAQLKLQDIVNSPSVDVACKKIDSLADKKQLDSTLMLMLTKAWSSAKESNMVKDEAKDILYHLYVTARGNLQRLMPKEIRIMKYLLMIEESEERISALKDAFTPGDEVEGKDVDSLYTTPEKLFTWILTVVDAYHHSREGTLIREARDLMNPKLIKRLEDLQRVIKDKFM